MFRHYFYHHSIFYLIIRNFFCRSDYSNLMAGKKNIELENSEKGFEELFNTSLKIMIVAQLLNISVTLYFLKLHKKENTNF